MHAYTNLHLGTKSRHGGRHERLRVVLRKLDRVSNLAQCIASNVGRDLKAVSNANWVQTTVQKDFRLF